MLLEPVVAITDQSQYRFAMRCMTSRRVHSFTVRSTSGSELSVSCRPSADLLLLFFGFFFGRVCTFSLRDASTTCSAGRLGSAVHGYELALGSSVGLDESEGEDVGDAVPDSRGHDGLPCVPSRRTSRASACSRRKNKSSMRWRPMAMSWARGSGRGRCRRSA